MNKRSKEEGITPVIIIVLVAVLTVGGFAYWSVSKKDNQNNKTLSSIKSDLPTDLSGLLSLDRIIELALAEKAGSSIKQIELEMINNQLTYMVQLLDGSLLAFNAKDGTKITLSDDEKSESEEDDLPTNIVVNITFQKAVEIAQSKYPTKTIRKVELEQEDGKVVYSVRFTDGSRVDVDATSGSINKAKDSLVEDKDKDDDGTEDEQEDNEIKNPTTNNTESLENNEDDSDSSDKTEDEDRDDDDDEEDKIEYQKPEDEDRDEVNR